MANPTPFVPGYSYTDYQETAPNDPLPGPQVDNDFANAARSTATLVSAVKDVRRSDGALKNGIVTLDALSSDVAAALAQMTPIDVPLATQDQAEAGATNLAFMSPLRTRQAMTAYLPSILGGDPESNPYEGPYPDWLSGIGGIGYYDAGYMATSGLFVDHGSSYLANPFPYGSLNPTMGLVVSVGSVRPGSVNGFTAPGQSASYDEFGMSALGTQADTRPLMLSVAGTFGLTTFTPTTPFTAKEILPGTAVDGDDAVCIAVGMWIRSNDSPSQYNGQIVSWTKNGGGLINQITVSGWYIRGGNGSAATPSGTYAYINPLDKAWTQLPYLYLNAQEYDVTLVSGSRTATLTTMDGVYHNGQRVIENASPGIGGIAVDTWVDSIDIAAKTLSLSKPAAASGTTTITLSGGTISNKGVVAEVDIFGSAGDFVLTEFRDTGTMTSGSFEVTVATIASYRVGLNIFSAEIGSNEIVGINRAANKIYLRHKTVGAGTGVAVVVFNQLDECGTGYDFLAVTGKANMAIQTRGNWVRDFVSRGAFDTSFLCQMGFNSPTPNWAFRTDGYLNGFPTLGSHAVTYGATALSWSDRDGGYHATDGYWDVAGNKKILDNTAWTVTTPTISGVTGTTGVSGAKTVRSKRVGSSLQISGKVAITTNGDWASGITVTLPSAAIADTVMTGISSTAAALTFAVAAGTSFGILRFYDGSHPGANGVTLTFSGEYEVAP
jgi:hypothetical protein